MSEEIIDSGKEPKKRDPDLARAEIAMKRAAAKARHKAEQVGGGVMVWKDGRVVFDFHHKAVGLDQWLQQIGRRLGFEEAYDILDSAPLAEDSLVVPLALESALPKAAWSW